MPLHRLPPCPSVRGNKIPFAVLVIAALAGVVSIATAQQPPSEPSPSPVAPAPAQRPGNQAPVVKAGSLTFNTVITKLKEGKQIFSNTLTEPDLEAAKKACEGQDFIWIEMQHSTLTWRETQQLIKVIA